MRTATPLLLFVALALGVNTTTRAAILYQFTATDSGTGNYGPANVTTIADPGVIAPVGGTALGTGNVGLNRLYTSEFDGFSLSDENGTSLDNDTEFGTGYFTWTVSAAPGNTLNLTSLDFGSARGGTTNQRGFEIYAALNGGAFTYGVTTPLLDVNDEVSTATRTLPRAVSIDLSGAAYQGISSITFRYYPLTAATGNTIDFTGMTLNGNVAAVPEPSSLLLLGGSFAGLLVWRRKI